MPDKPLSKDAVKDTTTNSEAEPTYHSSCSFERSNTVKENATGTDEKKSSEEAGVEEPKGGGKFQKADAKKESTQQYT